MLAPTCGVQAFVVTLRVVDLQHRKTDRLSDFQYARRALERSGAEASAIPGINDSDPKVALESMWRWRLKNLQSQSEVSTSSYAIASYHALLGNRDDAMLWLDRAFEHRDPSLVAVHVDEAFKRLRADARFQDLVRRIGLRLT